MDPDRWHLVARHLTPADLCTLMQCSRSWFYLWVCDRAWSHQRARILARHPALRGLFEKYGHHGSDAQSEHVAKGSIKSNANKKRKTAWITPRSGIWYVFKRWLTLDKRHELSNVKKLLKTPTHCDLGFAILRMALPWESRIVRQEYVTPSKIRALRFWLDVDEQKTFSTVKFVMTRGGYTLDCKMGAESIAEIFWHSKRPWLERTPVTVPLVAFLPWFAFVRQLPAPNIWYTPLVEELTEEINSNA